MKFLITYINERLNTQTIEQYSTVDFSVIMPEKGCIISVLADNIEVSPGDLTPIEKLVNKGVIKVENLNDSDFRQSQTTFNVNINSCFVNVSKDNMYNFLVSKGYNMGRVYPYQGSALNLSTSNPNFFFIVVNEDANGTFNGNAINIKAGVPTFATTVVAVGSTVLSFWGYQVLN